jgi:hypothetical protein
MNKLKSSSATIELIKLIDIFKISGHGHAIDRLGFKESEYNTYLEIDSVIDKLIKTHQEEMIDKLCLDNECWSKANSLSVHNFLNILQVEKLTKMLEATQQEIKKTSKKSVNINNDHGNNFELKDDTSNSVLNGQVHVLDEKSAMSLSHLNLSKTEINFHEKDSENSILANQNINISKSKMSVSTGVNVNSKIYTANAKSRHLPTITEASPKNMLSNYVFSGTTSTIDLEMEGKVETKKSK